MKKYAEKSNHKYSRSKDAEEIILDYTYVGDFPIAGKVYFKAHGIDYKRQRV
jgi:hypothetical protein